MISRRAFGKAVGAEAVAASLPAFPVAAAAGPAVASGLGPVRHVRTDLLDLAHHEVGPAGGDVVLLGNGRPCSPHVCAEVALAPAAAASACWSRTCAGTVPPASATRRRCAPAGRRRSAPT